MSAIAFQGASAATTQSPTEALTSAGGGDGIGTLREEAAKAGILIGSGAIKAMTTTTDGRPPNYLSDPQFRNVLAEQFNSLSPENDLKWMFVQPKEGVFDFEGLDRLVAFAKANDMEAKGHGLISACCNPDYLVAKIDDPVAFRAAMVKHFNKVMKRYKGKMDRWDVVSEPLTTFGGQGLQQTDFYKALGPGYVAEAFRIAHSADPKASLYLNENLVEYYPEKRQELYDLVSGLVADGVPIDGVALQMHETLQAPPPGVITEMVNFFHALGLEVSIAELDVHTFDPLSQAQIYGAVVSEALNAGITDISFWGFTDKHLYTWLPGAKPLIFDEYYNPKPAYFAVRDALRNFVQKRGSSPPAARQAVLQQ
ncbi:endo-1,4-beta-xylanase [Terrabacter sp. MAHUQ-38]|uniref:endo-1,4-beta-xylanase n=1 Tax=unclassified Terrabacter TaxID=2630222 RepID=UPI001CAA4D94|nr:endo-1,4-beta-xylanase [Terrabacter sp. MAHUQ-38]